MKQKKDKVGLCPEGMDLLLPWYLNQTLEKGENEEVRRHLQSCPICQQELEQIKACGIALNRHCAQCGYDR